MEEKNFVTVNGKKRKIPDFMLSEIKRAIMELKIKLADINLSINVFLKKPNARGILETRFPILARDFGWEYLTKISKEEEEIK